MQLIVKGLASSSIYATLDVKLEDEKKILLDFLNEKTIPIASSCSGNEQCKLCVNSNKLLTCNLSVLAYIQKYGEEIEFLYL